MPWRGPSYEGEFPSLGWGLVDLFEEYALVPSGLAHGQRVTLTDRQVAFVVRMHRIHPETGRYVYRRAVKEGPKGDGKSPLLAWCSFGHLVGPVVFDGWDANGDPVGKPHPTPWVQICALAEDQTDNCFMQLLSSLGGSKAVDDFQLDLGLSRICFQGKRNGKIEPVTSAGGTREGQPITFAGKEETQYWTPGKHGPELARTLDRNLIKTGGLSMAATNAFRRGEESVAEQDAEAAEKGARGLLYESIRGTYVADMEDRELVAQSLREAYDPQADWLDFETLIDGATDPTSPAGERRRFFLNIPDDFAEESWLPEGCWEGCRRKGKTLSLEHPFVGAVDMALKHDTAALRLGQYGPDGRIFTAAYLWTPDDGRLDPDVIEAKLIELHATGNLTSCAYDPAYFERSAQHLIERGVPMVEFPQSNPRMVPACGHAYELVVGGQVIHDDDPLSAAQVSAAVPVAAGEGWRVKKSKSRHKIDSGVALIMMLDELTRIPAVVPEFFGAWG